MFSVIAIFAMPNRPVAAPTRHLASRSLQPLSSERTAAVRASRLQAIAMALRRAFHNTSTIAAMFKRFQAMPLRKAAA